ncbi:hypothetical protein EYC84_000574 [Monilinia fructicola]|nr:hypothetical protein EYC84_000574 [Monilinia fructicola]
MSSNFHLLTKPSSPSPSSNPPIASSRTAALPRPLYKTLSLSYHIPSSSSSSSPQTSPTSPNSSAPTIAKHLEAVGRRLAFEFALFMLGGGFDLMRVLLWPGWILIAGVLWGAWGRMSIEGELKKFLSRLYRDSMLFRIFLLQTPKSSIYSFMTLAIYRSKENQTYNPPIPPSPSKSFQFLPPNA